MRQLCLTRYFLLYSTLCGLVLVIVVFYDISLTTAMIVPSFQPLLGELSRFVIPERFSSFCSIDKEELLNESVPQTIVIQQDQQQPQKEDETNWLKFDPNKSTEENYAAENNNDNSINSDMNGFMGRFASVRRRLDYSYHRVYTSERQRLQDRIISGMLDRTQRLACSRQQQYPTAIHDNNQQNDDLPDQWVIFTAGVMGVGKSHTIRALAEKQRFPLSAFVWVDPDKIRHCLPEFEMLVQHDPAHAGDRTRKEAGMLSEILTLAALEEGQSVIVDGSLRDAEWYEEYFTHLRETYPGIKIAIFHVTAPHEAVLERAARRAQITGRVVPSALLERAMVQVPASVQLLKTKADFFVELHNAEDKDVQIVQPVGMDWRAFERHWAPSCRTKTVTS